MERRPVIAALELRVAVAQRRLFVLNTVIPLALVGPIAIGGAPRVHAAVVFTLIIAFFGVFGQAIPLARDAERGLTARFLLAGVSPHTFVGQRIAAHAALDIVQLTPALLVIAIAYHVDAGTLAALAGATLLALVAGNALGVLIAALARSIAEAALFSAVIALFMLHAAGVFRAPVPGSVAEQVRAVIPFTGLHHAMQNALGHPAAIAQSWTATVAATAGVVAAVLLLAPLLTRSLTRARAG